MKAAESGLFCVKREAYGAWITLVEGCTVEKYTGKKGGVCLARTGDTERKPIFPAEKIAILKVPIAGIL